MDIQTQTLVTSSLIEALSAHRTPDHAKHLERIDQAWYQSGGSVVLTTRLLKQPYSKTLRDLTSPSVGLLPPDDPRIAAHAIALANIADGVSHTDKTPKDETQIASEKTAMVRLTSNPDNEHAIRTLIKVAESEITRDIHLKQQNTTQKTKTHTKHNTQTVR